MGLAVQKFSIPASSLIGCAEVQYFSQPFNWLSWNLVF
jgi:hypothetical protein